MGQGLFEGLLLPAGQAETERLFRLRRLSNPTARQTKLLGQEGVDPPGQALLTVTQIGQKNERRPFRVRPYLELFSREQVFQRPVNAIAFDFQQFGGLSNQVLLRKAGMAFFRLLLQ